MADHDYVCGASGLTIGYQPVRVLLLVERDYPEDFGIDGRYYPLSVAMRAGYNRDGNKPDDFVQDVSYRLNHEALKLGLSEGRKRPMEDLLERLPGSLTMRQIDRRRTEHPDSYSVKLGPRRAAPWVPTPKRVRDVLKTGGLEGYAAKVSYGHVKVSAGWDKKDDTVWYDKAAELLVTAGYKVSRNDEPTYGTVLIVRPDTAPLTLDDVRKALLSDGWPEASTEVTQPEEPVFEGNSFEVGGKPFHVTPEMQRDNWKRFHTEHGFRVEPAPFTPVEGCPEASVSRGFVVFHCVNGKPDPDAKGLSAYYSRLRACGIECSPESYKKDEDFSYNHPHGHIFVPHQSRSFESLVTQRRVRFLDNMADRYKRSLHHRTKRVLTWAVIREDVWQGLLKTQARKGYKPGDDGTFEARKAVCVKAFEKLLVEARSTVKELAEHPDRFFYRSIERKLDAMGRDFDVETAVWQDQPFRVGVKWGFCHLAAMRARDEITEEECAAAVNEFAELSHVRNVLVDLEHQWTTPHSGYQDVAYDVMAKVRADWAKLAKADLAADKAKRKKWGC
jgi:hypothetical protein